VTAGRAVLLLAVAAAACSSGRRTPEMAASVGGAGTETPVVTLERTPCFGTCPVYTVAISRSGTVRYEGRHHVTRAGVGTGRIPAARVDSLLAELEAGGYFGFADDYVMDSPACGMYATDSPTVITSATRGGVTKTVRHDRGCSAAPPELSRLEQRIDEVAETGKWTGRE